MAVLKKLRAIIGTSLAAVLLLAPAMPAMADTAHRSDGPEREIAVAPMEIAYYNEDIAEANGFEIITHPDGTQESIPVTEEAKASLVEVEPQLAIPSPGGGVTTFGWSAPGNCGMSYVSGAKIANDMVAVQTGYALIAPVVTRTWEVEGVTFLSFDSMFFPSGATPASYMEYGAFGPLVGPGFVVVPNTSLVQLTTGAVCYSLAPTCV